MIKHKQARTRKAGYRGSFNTQDFGPPVWTPDEDKRHIRTLALDLAHSLSDKQLAKRPGLIVTEAQRRAVQVARAAAKNLVEALG